jgi:hypothetical protein
VSFKRLDSYSTQLQIMDSECDFDDGMALPSLRPEGSLEKRHTNA